MKNSISILSALTLTTVIVTVTGDPLGKNVKYTPEALTAIKKLRELMGPLPQPYMNTDDFLINWIRGSDSGGSYKIYRNSTYSKYVFAPGFDLDKAAKNLEKTLAWRKENKIDSILSEDFSDMEKEYPYDVSRKDVNGRPFIVAEYRNWDVRKAMNSPPTDLLRVIRYLNYILDRVATEARLRQTTDYTYLIDVAGFNSDTHACPKCAGFYEFLSQQSETHYPQMIRNIFHVNAPKEFDVVAKIYEANLSLSSLKGFKTYDTNKDKWLKDGKIIPVYQIPQHFVEGTTTVTKKPNYVYNPSVGTCAGCKVTGTG